MDVILKLWGCSVQDIYIIYIDIMHNVLVKLHCYSAKHIINNIYIGIMYKTLNVFTLVHCTRY